jgi:Fe-S-cluster-containing hydrogenase component 2
VDIDPVACNYCNVCARRCPTAALWVARDQRQVEIDDLRCIACGICVDVCAKKAVCLSLLAPQAYAAGTAGAAGPSLGRRGWQGPPVTAGARNTPPAAETVGGQRATPTG